MVDGGGGELVSYPFGEKEKALRPRCGQGAFAPLTKGEAKLARYTRLSN